MTGCLPGSTVEMQLRDGKDLNAFLDSLFAGGGLVLSQVLQLTGLPTHMVQNWVKRGYISPPVAKKYSREQFCTLLVLNTLRDVFTFEEIGSMLGYVSAACGGPGAPAPDEAPCLLYRAFVETLGRLPEDAIASATGLDAIFAQALEPETLPPGLQRRLCAVLRVMVLAHLSAQLLQEARLHLNALD